MRNTASAVRRGYLEAHVRIAVDDALAYSRAWDRERKRRLGRTFGMVPLSRFKMEA